MTVRTFFIAAFMLIFAITGAAQDEQCPAIVQAALDATHSNCDGIDRNQACYGNVTLEEQPEIDSFQSPGDMTAVDGIEALTLSSLDAAAQEWGIALLKVQANLPNTLPGQNITFVLFGDVSIENGVASNTEPPIITVITKGDASLYRAPDADSELLSVLARDASLTADARTTDGAWLRVTQAETGASGWVENALVKGADNVTALDTVDAEGNPTLPFNPMQIFYFRTGVGDAPCAAAPDSGILIQTPHNSGELRVFADDVEIVLASSVYLQAEAGGDMLVSVIDGQARISAWGVTVVAPAGTRVRIPLDPNLFAAGPPDLPVPYDAAALVSLPISLLPEIITIAPPAEGEAAPEATEAPSGGGSAVILSGTWQAVTTSAIPDGCAPEGEIGVTVETLDEQTLLVTVDNGQVYRVSQRSDPIVYVGSVVGVDDLGSFATVEVLGQDTFSLSVGTDACTFSQDFTLVEAAGGASASVVMTAEAAADVLPIDGTWHIESVSVTGTACSLPPLPDTEYAFALSDNGDTLTVTINGSAQSVRTRAAPNVYVFHVESDTGSSDGTMSIDSPSHFAIQFDTTSKVGLSPCTFVYDFTLVTPA